MIEPSRYLVTSRRSQRKQHTVHACHVLATPYPQPVLSRRSTGITQADDVRMGHTHTASSILKDTAVKTTCICPRKSARALHADARIQCVERRQDAQVAPPTTAYILLPVRDVTIGGDVHVLDSHAPRPDRRYCVHIHACMHVSCAGADSCIFAVLAWWHMHNDVQ